jgi:hypothetical protein
MAFLFEKRFFFLSLSPLSVDLIVRRAVYFAENFLFWGCAQQRKQTFARFRLDREARLKMEASRIQSSEFTKRYPTRNFSGNIAISLNSIRVLIGCKLSLSYSVFLQNLFKMGKSAKLSFFPRTSGEFLSFWENFSKTANFWLKIGRNSPKL